MFGGQKKMTLMQRMCNVTQNKVKQGMKIGRKRGGKWRWRGLMADAKALGVCAEHLSRVLDKERRSPGLVLRYRELKADQRRASKRQPGQAGGMR
jgi:hypothetical protein